MASDSSQKRTFYYQAGASSVGGFLTKPNPQVIPSGASTLVPSVGGGRSNVQAGMQAVDSIISYSSTDASANGGEQETEGILGIKHRHFSMQVSSTVTGLSLLGGKVAAATVVTQASAKYSRDGESEFSFASSAITGLTISGCEVTVTFKKDYAICGERFDDRLPQQICIVDSVKVNGECPGIVPIDHHTLEVAGVGRLSFGEGVKFPNGPVQVCLIRIELDTSTGSANGIQPRVETTASIQPQSVSASAIGSISVGSGVVGGSPVPPN